MTRLSIERPLTVLMGILTLVLMGAVAYTYLKVDRLPPLSFAVVFVDVIYGQAAAQDVEELVTKPIEDALAGVAGAATITSTSNEGRSRVRIQLVEGTNPDLATIDVERRIARIRNRLPSDAGDPIVRKADPNEQPIMNVALIGGALDELYDIATTQIAPALQSVPGVAAVDVTGGLQREVQVLVDSTRLSARNVSVQQVSTALAAANVTSTVGRYQQGGQLLNLRAIGRFQTAEQLRNLVIAQTPGGPVLLRDVATVEDGFKEQTRLQRLDGEDAVGIWVVKASDANALLVADGIAATLKRLEPLLPKGSEYQVRNDTSIFIRSSLDAIRLDLFLAVLLVDILRDGASRVNGRFLSGIPSRLTERAGVAPALAGSAWILALTALVGFPLGVGTALWLEEYAPDNRFRRFVETNISNLAGVPSIVYGILGLAVFVRALSLGRSVLSAALTLTLLVLPVIIIAAQEAIKAVPNSIRLGAYALGATRWEAIRHQVLPLALPGILTGTILAVSRAVGEAAPVIMVGALGFIAFVPDSPGDAFTVIPFQIYSWVSRPQAEWKELAAAASLVLLALLLTMNAAAIYLRNRFSRRY